MAEFVIRDFQEKAAQSPYDHWANDNTPPIVVSPTGSGKSVILARMIVKANKLSPGVRIIVLSHVSEILVQNAKALLVQWPECRISFCSDKLGKKKLDGQVIFATIQSIHKKAFSFTAPVPELIFIDECHLLSDDEDSMYRKFLAAMGVASPDMNFAGLSATPFRAKTGYLHKGKNSLFKAICYEIGILDLINMGYLVPVSTPQMKTIMDASGVKIQGGDYVQKQLEKKVDTDEYTIPCVDEIILYGVNRKKWLIFAAGISHCEHIRDEIRKRGISCEMVTGKTPTAERNRIVSDHRTGTLQAVVNVGVFTTGYDNPAIDLIAFMRPTRSPVLYIQMMGRSMRTALGKTDALCLDFGGVVSTLGPIDRIHLPEKQKGDGTAPVKTCPECDEVCHAAVRLCVNCGYEFPEPELKIDNKASNAAVLSTQLKKETKSVTNVLYYRHEKAGGKPSLRVEYMCGLMESYREWITLEHTGYAREKACKWWAERSPGLRAPNTIDEALARKEELRKPSTIDVRRIDKYFEIVGYEL